MEGRANRKKNFHELSTIAQFHIAPKIFGEETQHPFNEELSDIQLNTRQDISKCIETKLSTPEGIHMQEILQNALNVKLNDEAKNNSEEKRKLDSAKEKIKEYTNNVLDSIKNYMKAILASEEIRNSDRDKDKIANTDDNRRRCHNILIDSINILNRSLIWWFGEFDSGNLSDAQMKMYEKQKENYITYNIKRINIPPNGIYHSSYNTKERDETTRWASAIYKDLALIQKLSGTIS